MEEFEEVPAPPTNHGAADGKFSFGEIFIRRRYPEGISKSDKNALRKRTKFFRVNDKDLYYIGGGIYVCIIIIRSL